MSHSIEQFAAAAESALGMKRQIPQRSNWTPLIELVGEKCADDFMFMGDVEAMNLYKHINTRRYINIDRHTLQCYRFVPAKDIDEVIAGKARYEPIATQEAIAYALSS